MKRPSSIFISHAWGGISDEILAQLVKRLEAEDITFILDKRDLSYRQSIHDFMVQLGEADMVIIILSNKYLKSEYCMFELLEIHKNENLSERIFPIVLDEVKISSSADRLEFVKYWETQLMNLQNKVKELNSLSYIEGITDDLNLYAEIRNNIARLTGILRDINTLNITIHRESDYEDLVKAIKEKISGNREKKQTPVHHVNSSPSVLSSGNLKKAAIIVFALFGLFMAWGILTKSNMLAGSKQGDTAAKALPDSSGFLQPNSVVHTEIAEENRTHLNAPDTNEHLNQSQTSRKQQPEKQKPVIPSQNQSPKTQPSIVNGASSKPVEKAIEYPLPSTSSPTIKPPADLNNFKASSTISKGTELQVKSSVTISSDDGFAVPKRVSFLLDKPLLDGKNIILPAGSSVTANVVYIKASNYKRAGVMDLVFDYLKTPDGQKLPLQTNEFHLIAKGDIPMEINTQTIYKIKTSSTLQINY